MYSLGARSCSESPAPSRELIANATPRETGSGDGREDRRSNHAGEPAGGDGLSNDGRGQPACESWPEHADGCKAALCNPPGPACTGDRGSAGGGLPTATAAVADAPDGGNGQHEGVPERAGNGADPETPGRGGGSSFNHDSGATPPLKEMAATAVSSCPRALNQDPWAMHEGSTIPLMRIGCARHTIDPWSPYLNPVRRSALALGW